jgi:hypothetical protein
MGVTAFNWSDASALYELQTASARADSALSYLRMRLDGCNATEAAEYELVRQQEESQELTPVHKAVPGIVRGYHCRVCGQGIKRVPGGSGPVYVHADSGAVAAPNPPLVAPPGFSAPGGTTAAPDLREEAP